MYGVILCHKPHKAWKEEAMWRRGALHLTRRTAFYSAAAGAISLAAYYHQDAFLQTRACCEAAVGQGELFVWGDKLMGSRDGQHDSVLVHPEALKLPRKVAHMAFADHYAAAADTDGNVWAWGKAAGCGAEVAKLVLRGKRAVKVACGEEVTYVMTKGGRVFSWRNDAPESVSEVSLSLSLSLSLPCAFRKVPRQEGISELPLSVVW